MMCHYCSMELADTGDRRCSQMCFESFCGKSVEKEASLALYGDKSVLFCKYCSQDYGNEPLEQDGWSYYSTPLTSPAMSLTSYESCVSSLGELLVELNFRSEDEEEGDLEICQEDCCQGYSRYLEDQLEGNSLEGIGIENYNDGAKLDNFSSPLQGDESTRFSSIVLEHLDDSKEEKLPISSEPLGVGSAVDKPVTFSEEQIKLYPPINIDTDPHIWAPPEPESQEEDTDCSVPDNEGDHRDGYDGRKWGQSCSSSSPDDELGGSYSFKEQRQKAMVEVMNGHFRALVRKLLTLEAVPFSEESRDSWLDIVTYVSWKAATLIKPDVNNKGSDMDPRSYTKVKCIASGNRRESQVIRGLVFSKKAAHKHMLTNYKNPQLLLFYGGLGDTEGGLSSFNSIEQEIRYLQSTIELVESCCPNVVLVEKAVSHDVQESLQAKGITLVFDMKLSRLERIARCTGSSIVSSPEELMNTKLKQCDSFHTEKVVEEHYFSYDEGAKQLTKTLMFFEGCPIPLGCTILLKGAHYDELKKVKLVVQQAVSLAYCLILETSFLVDQRAMFSNTHTVGIGNDNLKCDDASNMIISSLGGSSSLIDISSEQFRAGVNNEFQMPSVDEGQILLDPKCILILLTSRCILRGTACKQNQLSRIKFYGNSDMPLGQFLHDILLNQKHQCSTCGKPPEAHEFSYFHKKGKLSVALKQIPSNLLLSGEEKGKLWMWRLCLKCGWENGIPKPTHRVMMSRLAQCLSFGKFLDLSISNSTSSSRLASCGHLLHRDCLQFYGLGSMVAMVRYSTVDIYSACMPSPILKFDNPNGQEWLLNEAKDASLQKSINKNGNVGQTAHQILNLNCLSHELLLKLYVWDRRLQLLQLLTSVSNANHSALHKDKMYMHSDEIHGQKIDGGSLAEHDNRIAQVDSHFGTVKDETYLSPGNHHFGNVFNAHGEDKCILVAETSKSDAQVSQPLLEDTVVKSTSMGSGICKVDDAKISTSLSSSRDQQVADGGEGLNHSTKVQYPSSGSCDHLSTFLPLNDMDCQKDHTPTSDHIAAEISRQDESVADSILKIEERACGSASGECSVKSLFKELHLVIPSSQRSMPSNLEDYESWVWTPLSETCKAYRKDLQKGQLQRFNFINSYIPSYLRSIGQLISPERSRLHFPIDGDEKIVSSYEDEFSSIIASALVLLQDQYCSEENNAKDKDIVQQNVDKLNDNPNKPSSDVAMDSLHEPLTGLDQEGLHSGCYFDPDQLPALSLEGFFSLDYFLLSKALHPEISLGNGNLTGQSKYSVICMYAKQFYALRMCCCPSELDYISSLSRSKKWDARGGKSGVSFSKTLDDRFIVKQVKKTELNSFLMYAPEYFKHTFHSLSSGSQTCLAKILGIYQVIIRQSKSRRELRTTLVVMENLFYGRNITKSYDLKGVIHSRYASDAKSTLLDKNFVEEVSSSPLFVGVKTKQHLQRAIWNDTSFLTSVNVMDYSLLLGVDDQKHEIVFGIIDYLRQYTWDKHLESWVKTSLVVPKNEMPTVISPKEYKKRFRKFISTYFFAIPDRECSHRFPSRPSQE